MPRIEKTVFISYRRTNALWALAIYHYLTHHGYDVFYDYQGIASGDFEQVILENIKARAHFLVVLTPSALERCEKPGDWLRREIETALETGRNVVPLMLEGFDFGSPSIAKYLTGTLVALKSYNGLTIPAEYFDEAMTRLRERYLNVPLNAVLHPISKGAQQAVRQQQAAASAAPAVAEKELMAQEWFEQGNKYYDALKYDESIHAYSEALRLKPDYVDAYYIQGKARDDKSDLDGAIRDYDQGLGFEPDVAIAYNNRGLARQAKGDLDGALRDYDQALRLRPNDAYAYNNRGNARQAKGDLDGALRDYDQAMRLRPFDAKVYSNRGIARTAKGDLDGALRDYDQALLLNPYYVNAYYNRAIARKAKGDLDGAISGFRNYLNLGGGRRYGKEATEKIIRDLEKKQKR